MSGKDARPSLYDTQRIALWASVAVLALLLAPGVAAGIALAEFLRRRRLSWTWVAVGVVPLAPLLVLVVPRVVLDLFAAVGARPELLTDPGALVARIWPLWFVAVFPVTALWKLWRDHRARISGGAREKQASAQHGPLAVLEQRAHNKRETAAGPFADGAVLLGVDERGRQIRLPKLIAHALIVGGSNTGKTNTAEVLLEGHVAAGSGVIVMDGKGGASLARSAATLGARYGRPVALWSIFDYGDPALDALRVPWNATGEGNPTEIKDRIASSEEQSEPYYAMVAQRGLLMAARALTITAGTVSLDQLAACLDDPGRLKSLLRAAGRETFADDLDWLETLGEPERSGLRGMGLRLRTMVDSDGGHWLLPASDGREISLYRAVTEGWLVVFTLPQGMYPELIPHVTRYAMSAINGVCSRIESESSKADCVVLVDELSAFKGDQFAATYERARSAGVSVIVSTQSVSNLATVGGTHLLDGALDNSDAIFIHRQTVPDAAELLAGVAGTEEAWEHTHQVQDGRSVGSALGMDFGLDESGQRARRRTDRFLAHPNDIKRLAQGHAIVVSTRDDYAPRRSWWRRRSPAPRVQRVAIRPGLTVSPAVDA